MTINYGDIDQLYQKLVLRSLPIDFEEYDPDTVVEDPLALLGELQMEVGGVDYDPDVDGEYDPGGLVSGEMPAVEYDPGGLVSGEIPAVEHAIGRTNGRDEALDLLSQIQYNPCATHAFEMVPRCHPHREIKKRPSWQNHRSQRPPYRSPMPSRRRDQRQERRRPHARPTSRSRGRRRN